MFLSSNWKKSAGIFILAPYFVVCKYQYLDFCSLPTTFQFLSQCVVGISLEEIEEEEEDAESVASGEAGPALPKEGCYEIIGTLKDKNSRKPDFVKELINVCLSTFCQSDKKRTVLTIFFFFLI